MDAAERHAAGLEVLSREPLNAQPPLARLAQAPLTPAEDFYIRSHGDLPELDASRHRLRVTGLVERPLDLSLAELAGTFAPVRSSPPCSARATGALTCRR